MGFFSDIQKKKDLGLAMRDLLEVSRIDSLLDSPTIVFANKLVLMGWKCDPDYFNGKTFGESPSDVCALLYITLQTIPAIQYPDLKEAMTMLAYSLYEELLEAGFTLNASVVDSHAFYKAHELFSQVEE
ncbi:hypothetical protein [Marinobacter sp. F4216]|uniref:hypothetical protein n=1 Tax=Marinobacter sp. F4216 TaxID=2874281 RepID=UPI001CBD0AD4|nr:hypothetical protein [Marinobacter sp. F4216]MBZ2170084.1 hypothetical protein [Marinobacter sp. F4216]